MGLFKKLFGGDQAAQNPLDKVVTTIAHGLEQVRRGWFEGCLRKLRQAARDDAASPGFSMERTTLAGDAERAMKAYQVHVLEEFCANQRYVSSTDQKPFSEALRNRVFASDHEGCELVLSRYGKVSSLPGPDENTIGLFVDDIISWIAGRPYTNSLEEMVVLQDVDIFGTISAIVVADAFGDPVTARRIRARLSDHVPG